MNFAVFLGPLGENGLNSEKGGIYKSPRHRYVPNSSSANCGSGQDGFSQLEGHRIDCGSTLKWHHKFVGVASRKVALEFALTGGMLTNRKPQKVFRKHSDRYCPWGCRVEDTPLHIYWSCCMFREVRTKWGVDGLVLPLITQTCGIFLEDGQHTESEVLQVQGSMAAVMREAAEDSKKSSSEKRLAVASEGTPENFQDDLQGSQGEGVVRRTCGGYQQQRS